MARLRLTEKADKEIDKLDRSVKGAMWDFMRKFRQDPANPGLRFKQLKADSRLYSARVTDDYRALMLHLEDDEYMLVTVKHRSESYDNTERYAYQINQVTGGIDFNDMASLAGTIKPPAPVGPPPLFARYSDAQLIELGVGRPLLSAIGKITTEEQLLEFADCVPQLTADVLLALYDGASVEEVMEQVTAPVSAEGPVDPTDYAAAADRPASLVTTDDETLQAILAGGFERWQVYLHPVQRRVVERAPAARLGSAGVPALARPSSRCTGSDGWSSTCPPAAPARTCCSRRSTRTSPPTCGSGCCCSAARSSLTVSMWSTMLWPRFSVLLSGVQGGQNANDPK